MLLTVNYPAIVTGHATDGSVRRELVRVPSHFEIAEVSASDLPLSFVVNGTFFDGRVSEVRSAKGEHYERWTHDAPSVALAGSLRLSLYTGKNIDFRPLTDVVRTEIAKLALDSHTPGVSGSAVGRISVVPTKRELSQGLDPFSSSCMRAPLLRNWRWLGPDAESELADWKAKTQAVLSNIVIVDGNPHVRCFEPCYEVVHPARSNFRKEASVYPGRARAYSRFVDCAVTDPETGLAAMGAYEGWSDRHFFPAHDKGDILRFVSDMGWNRQPIPNGRIDVLATEPPFLDYAEMEAVRFGKLLLQSAMQKEESFSRKDGGPWYGEAVNVDELSGQIGALRSALLDWQDGKRGAEIIAAPFEALLEHMEFIHEASHAIREGSLLEKIDAFKVREDSGAVRIPAVFGATARL